jgi:hypothetical protein
MTLPHFAAGLCAGIVVGTAVLTAQQTAPAPGPRQEVVTDTASSGSGKQTRNDVFVIDERGQRRLVETTESTQETLANGKRRTVATTKAPDANGRLGVTSQYTEETTTTASGRRETVGSVLVRGVDGALQESRRTESTEREVRPGVVFVDSIERVRGQGGGWETAEVRSRETRPLGPGESLEDETIQRQDASGRLAVSQRNVTRRTEANGRVTEVTETFGDNRQGSTRPGFDTPMALSQRVTRTTTAATGGGTSTVEEVEGRSLAAPNEPMRVVRRIVETVRTVGSGQSETQRQVFERDTNGRMVPISSDTNTSQPPAATPRAK